MSGNLANILYVVLAYFFVNTIAIAFNLSAEFIVLLNILPTIFLLVVIIKAIKSV